jgi:hypothetical protein
MAGRIRVYDKIHRFYRELLVEKTVQLPVLNSQLPLFVVVVRKILTFVLGQLRTLQELIDFVPKEREDFLHFLPRQELQAIDEEGEYHNLVKEIGDVSLFLNDSLLHFQKTILEDIQSLARYLTLVNQIYPLQPLRPEIVRLSRWLNQLQFLKRRATYSGPVFLENLLLLLVQTKFKRVVTLANRSLDEAR